MKKMLMLSTLCLGLILIAAPASASLFESASITPNNHGVGH
jgi:hypothetical protein